MKRGLVLLDSPLPRDEILQPLVTRADYVVAADGGANLALERGIELDAVVGDLDGIWATTLARLPRRLVHRSQDPDTTDVDKAVAHAIRKGCTRITLAGASAGRLDHTLANLSMMLKYRERARLELVDDDFTTRLLERATSFRAAPGTIVSLVAVPEARGVTTRGLRWPLRDFTLTFSSRGVHNEVRRSPALVSLTAGALLLLVGHDVLRHR